MGQALSAAKQTVAADRQCTVFTPTSCAPLMQSSHHLRRGDIRDGQTVSTRRVKAIQGGKPSSIQRLVSGRAEGFEHQIAMPAGITPPSSSRANWSWCVPTSIRSRPPCVTRSCARTIEIRPVTLVDRSVRMCTSRAPCLVQGQCQMPEISGSTSTCWPMLRFPLPVYALHPMASLTGAGHAGGHHRSLLWFHRDFRLDEWLLYVVAAPVPAQVVSGTRPVLYRDGVLGSTAAGGSDPPARLTSMPAIKNGSQWLPFCFPTGSQAVHARGELYFPTLCETVGPRAMTPSPVTLQAVPKLSCAR